MGWHRNPGPGSTWITDEQLREVVETQALEAGLSQRLNGDRPLVEDAVEYVRFLECLRPDPERPVESGSVLHKLAEQAQEARERGLA